ncbi:hypothetical protein [Phytohabitans aurantiacus]|uniref:Uncharacterized protein n=1 Tax=Phytohabitans aurantiacus TaxID=3016789 RepID=A0ABQ5R146_9ACTN|nr:hypothetical protein [Phytohabitans aurantiacus]GLH99901.1 hypothetical protein Pa4123_51770 [Phytohabitans aurantiacus]
MAEAEAEDGCVEGSLQAAIDALRLDNEYRRLTAGKVRRSEDQILLLVAVRQLVFRFGSWSGFLARRAKIDKKPEPTSDQIAKQRGELSGEMNGRGERPYPKLKATTEIFRVALHGAESAEREAVWALVSCLWKRITGEDVDLPAEGEQNASEDTQITAQQLIMAAVAGQRRAEAAVEEATDERRALAERCVSAETALQAATAREDVLMERIRELDLKSDFLMQENAKHRAARHQLEEVVKRAHEERDAERHAAAAAQAKAVEQAQAAEAYRRVSAKSQHDANAKVERLARMVAWGEAEGRPIDRQILRMSGIELDIFGHADRNQKAICAYLTSRWHIVRYPHPDLPPPIPKGINPELVDRTYNGQGPLPPWEQFVAIVESIGGQLSFIASFYTAVKAQETPVDHLKADFSAIMDHAQIPGLTEEKESSNTGKASAVAPKRWLRLPTFLRLRKIRLRKVDDASQEGAEQPGGNAETAARKSRREAATQRNLYQ